LFRSRELRLWAMAGSARPRSDGGRILSFPARLRQCARLTISHRLAADRGCVDPLCVCSEMGGTAAGLTSIPGKARSEGEMAYIPVSENGALAACRWQFGPRTVGGYLTA